MKVKILVVDLELTHRQKRVTVGAIALAAALAAGAAVADVPKTFVAGEKLTAASLNSNFEAFDARAAALELGAAREWQSYDVDIVEREVPNAPITGVAENVGFYRRTGDSIEVRIYTEFSAAPAGGNYLAWTLPDGLSIDSAKLPGGSIGFGFRDALGVAELDGVAGVVGPAPGSLVDAIAAGDAVGPANGAVPLGAGSTINLSFTVPVVP